MKEKKPIIKTPASDNPYEVFLSPEKLAEKRAKQAELARAEVAEQSQEEVEQPQQLVTTTEESMEETKSETIVREQTVADAESFTPEEKKMTATEMREAREREEEGIAALAQDLFEKRMQGHGAEMVDAILIENGITPWTPEAEEFMRKWDWEQAAAKLAPIEQDRQTAIEQVNGIEPKKLIELSEKEEGVIAVQLAQFNMQPADLEQISGFDTLSYGQRLLVIENLRQATLGRIQEEATDRHRAEVAGAAWYGKIWRNAFSKLRIAKHEKETAQEIMQGGLAHHREVLAQLTTGAENMGLDVLVEKDGSLTVQYLGKNELLSPAEQEQVAKFNTAAQKFSTVPAEWSFAPEGSKEYKEYTKAFQEFDQFKRTLLATEGNIFGEKNAMHAMSNADFKIRSNQFFNTHPDAMKELVAIKSDAIWTRGLGDMFKERGAQTSLGYIGRAMGASLLGKAAALPIVGGVIGMFMARKRAKESLHTQERQMRGGKNVDARFADMMYTTVPATTLGEKLERALHAVSTSEPDSEQHKKALATLRARLEYSQFKLEEGRIDFGSREVHTGNQYDLFDKIGAGFALLEQTAITDELESEEKAGKRFNRLDKMFTAEQNTVEDLRRIYKNKEMLKGMAIGATFSIVGYLIADTLAGTGNAHAATGPESVPAIKKSINLAGEPGAHTARVNGVAGAVGKVAALSSVGEKVGGGVANVAATESASLNFVEGGNIAAATTEQSEISGAGAAGKVAALSAVGEQANVATPESAPLNFVEGGNIAAAQETIPTVATIGARGAEGSIIDTLKTNPELAKKLGWDGVTDLKEWSGKEAHALWLADAKEQLAKPEMIEKLKNAGYTPDAKGYAEAMQHIAKGSIAIDPITKTINLENIEFVKARVTVIPSVVPVEQPVAAPQIVSGHAVEDSLPKTAIPVAVAPQIVGGSEAVAEAVAPQIVSGSAVETVTAPAPTAEAELTKTEAVTSAPVNKEAVAAPKSPVVAQELVATPTSEILHSSAPIVNPERIALLEANINTDRTNAASHIVDHYKAGDITAQDFTAYYAGMVNGVRNDEQTITRVQQLFQSVIAGASPEIKTNAMGELTKIVKQLQKT
ncbi:MAG: hypothetical protein UW32_C0001G0397 [Candidatus Wolfebacteria bacterium GW2011_GWE2_44_13]|uniref:Uncharacterized protein n=1 Tax=Candidatus Wolfebacteria bacterium GW2011_GWE2_44_13 TaxID=1619017 RepID=A0A0G1HAK1_9BACT|nr:MAG: hypothetical protein UW32_C0001G0397 [Candidatus Wolfebacteria bacterium GW2011_GWE2_44_13]